MPALNATELGYLRDDHPHRIIPYLSVLVPSIVYVGTVNGAHARGARAITVTDVSGTIGDIEAGMTVLVGTTTSDYSISKRRFRSRSGQILTVDENSVAWSVGDTLTVVKNWELWPVYPFIDTSDYTFYKDRDVAYTDENENPVPVAIAGTHRAGFLEDGSVSFDIDASDSYVITSEAGAVIGTYLWECDGGSIADSAAAATTITFTVAGQYWLKLTVTDSEQRSQSTRRAIFVHDRTGANAPFLKFSIEVLRGDWSTGGWETDIRVFGDAPLSSIPDGALVVIWTETWYGSSKINIGSTNEVVFAGHIREESIKKDLDTGEIVFQAATINKLLDEARMYSVSLEFDSVPTKWYQYKNLTTTRAVHHFWRYHSTLFDITDVYLPTDDTKFLIAVDDFENGTLYSMVESFVNSHGIFAHLCCNKGGQLRMEREVNMINDSDRSSVATIFSMTDQDRKGETDVEIMRDPVERAAYVMLSGTYYDGSTVRAICSQAPGAVMKPYGSIITFDRIVLSGQADGNYLAGKILEIANRDIIELRIQLAGNYLQILDVSLQEWINVTLDPTDTKRKLDIDSDNYIVRNITATFSIENGVVDVRVVLEPEIVDSTAGVFWMCVGDPAYVHPDPDFPELPPLPDYPLPPVPDLPPIPPPADPPSSEVPNVAFVMSETQLARTINFNESVPVWQSIKPSGSSGTYLQFNVSQANKSAILVEFSGDYGIIFYTADVMATSVVWVEILNDVSINADFQTEIIDPGIFTLGASGFHTILTAGVMLEAGTIYALVKRHVSGGYNDRICFLFTSFNVGGTWLVNWYEDISGDLATTVPLQPWAIDVNTGFVMADEQKVGGTTGNRGPIVLTGASSTKILTPEFGPGDTGVFGSGSDVGSYSHVFIGGIWYAIADDTNRTIYTTSEGGVDPWEVYQVGGADINWLGLGAGLTRSSLGNLYYVRSLDALGGANQGIYRNNVLQVTSLNLLEDTDGRIGHITTLGGDDLRYGTVKLKSGSPTGGTRIVFWIEYGVIHDKTGNLESIIGAWAGSGSSGGGAMLVVFNEYI